MATTASVRATSPNTRPRPSSASPTSPPTIARGATARSAVSRTPSSLASSAATRRASVKLAPGTGPSPQETRESLSASLKQETEQKEQLLVQIQNKEQTITSLTEENTTLSSALSAAESRVNELYADQARSETDLAQRIEVAEKLRTQVRELEKEKRDLQRRYNEQTATFEAERQAFYDNEQHLKSRIQSLTQQLKQRETAPTFEETTLTTEDEEHEAESEAHEDAIPNEKQLKTPVRQNFDDPDDEPAEMTALKLELSTLSTSYSSMQNTLVLLQTQLVDLKRVNREVQEENESYMILLQEKTLSGQFNLMRQVGQVASDEDEDEDGSENLDARSMHSNARSALEPVDELAEESFEDHIAMSRTSSRPGRRRAASSTSSGPRGETLADLPISGPGLDLAAELGRAENKDINGFDSFEDRNPVSAKNKRSKKATDARKAASNENKPLENSESVNFNDIDALRNEVKSLKDANKALSLYASKIIDRIISQEGFEHVLAVDYEKQPSPAASKSPGAKSPLGNATNLGHKARPQSVIVERTASAPAPEPKKAASPPMPAQSFSQPTSKANRRSMSFDWRGFSLFSPTTEKKPELRPLTLQPGASPVTGRKLDTQEDEDDRKERERLNATMKLMGIEPQPQRSNTNSPAIPPLTPTAVQRTPSTEAPADPARNRRFSFWGFKNTNSDASSVNSKSSAEGPTGLGITPGLTQEALEQAEAQNTLAALDAHERTLSAELARGGSSGFTEISPRMAGRRSRRSAGGSSGSTVWSAGMSAENE